jgi:predicted protein tyrosine phosphatase
LARKKDEKKPKRLRVLFICSGNLERSPTAEQVFRNWVELDVKSAGSDESAINPLSKEIVEWADMIFAMEDNHKKRVLELSPSASGKIVVLGIEDVYYRSDPGLVKILKKKVTPYIKEKLKAIATPPIPASPANPA